MVNPFMKIKACFLKPVLLFALAAAATAPAVAFDKVNESDTGVAIKGYDPVAYFIEGRAVMGSSRFSYKWQDAEWHFASAADRDLFVANPERYAPQYGGYCAYSMAAGRVAGIDPQSFKIVDGKLYLNWSNEIADKFGHDAAENIKKGDENWVKMGGSN
jgi:hypothetical protein